MGEVVTLDDWRPSESAQIIQHSSSSSEWYTPSQWVEAARVVMGSIDLDPASSDYAQLTVRAGTYYTIETDGLSRPWFGNVFLNPPYGRVDELPSWSQVTKSFGSYSAKEIWIERLLMALYGKTIRQAVLLVTSSTGDAWFQALSCHIDGLCFPPRINFYTLPSAGPVSAQPGSNVFCYFGPNQARFVSVFRDLGMCPTTWTREVISSSFQRFQRYLV